MNRELKFRIWNNTIKYFVENLNGEIATFTLLTLSDYLQRNSITNIDDFTFPQYTGLQDKNKKEIYEGDIIKWGQKARKIECKNQKSVADFSTKIFSDEIVTTNIGAVVFDVINDIDDFYSPYVLGYGVRYRLCGQDKVTSLHQLLEDYGKEILIEYAYAERYGQFYELVGNIFENPGLLT